VGLSIGPGEVLLPERETIPREVNRLGHDLVLALNGEKTKLSERINQLTIFDPERKEDQLFTEQNCCPYCFSTAFELINSMELRCAFCHWTTVNLHPEGGRIQLQFETLNEDERLEYEKRHLEEEVRPSGPSFLARWEEIKERRQPYADIGVGWGNPPVGKR
jgi:hypothetical protein